MRATSSLKRIGLMPELHVVCSNLPGVTAIVGSLCAKHVLLFVLLRCS